MLLTQKAAQVMVQALVISRLDYCNSLLIGLPACAIRPLQLIQNAAARLVFNLPKFSHTTPLLRSLHWLPIAARIRFKTLVLTYRATNGSAPAYIQDMVKPYTPTRPLRSASAKLLAAPSQRGRTNHSTKSRLLRSHCPDSQMVEQAPYRHQDGRKPTHLPPKAKNTSLPTTPRINKK